ncbi:MAG: FHA domain-containing protein [Anaerolineae bacterium]|nr:FHA domain-containing protein [Anaerolineae bacterium]
MIKCHLCQTTHVANTIFCDECGTYLLGEENRETDPLDAGTINWVGGTAYPYVGSPLVQNGRTLLLCLKIGDNKREVEIPLNKFISLGRMDPTANIFPEIDLTHDGDLAKSVSRRHLSIYWQNGTIFIEDLGSINGTFVNGCRLAPYLPERLNDGDLLQLGRLLIEVKFQSI